MSSFLQLLSEVGERRRRGSGEERRGEEGRREGRSDLFEMHSQQSRRARGGHEHQDPHDHASPVASWVDRRQRGRAADGLADGDRASLLHFLRCEPPWPPLQCNALHRCSLHPPLSSSPPSFLPSSQQSELPFILGLSRGRVVRGYPSKYAGAGIPDLVPRPRPRPRPRQRGIQISHHFSESPKPDFLVSAEYEPSVTRNHRIFGRNRIFGNCLFIAEYSVILPNIR